MSKRPTQRRTAQRRRFGRRARAFTLVEATVAAAVVGVMFVAALGTIGAAARSRRVQSQKAQGQLLAEDLLAEVLQQAYRDPTDTGNTFGPEPGENNRQSYDDVDDYDGYAGSQIALKDGTQLKNFDGWKRQVAVAFVDPRDLTRPVTNETGVKRVTVTATYNGAAVATATSVIADVPHGSDEDNP